MTKRKQEQDDQQFADSFVEIIMRDASVRMVRTLPGDDGVIVLANEPRCPDCGGHTDSEKRPVGGLRPYRIEKRGIKYTFNLACSCIYGAIYMRRAELRGGIHLRWYDDVFPLEPHEELPF